MVYGPHLIHLVLILMKAEFVNVGSYASANEKSKDNVLRKLKF